MSAVLASAGIRRPEGPLHATLAFRDEPGRRVDLHPLDPTDDGRGGQVLHDRFGRWHCAPPVEGSIDGQAVRCSSPEDQMLMHLGHAPGALDIADVHRPAK